MSRYCQGLNYTGINHVHWAEVFQKDIAPDSHIVPGHHSIYLKLSLKKKKILRFYQNSTKMWWTVLQNQKISVVCMLSLNLT